MGPLLVLVCPCFRENVIVTCKIVSLSCSLDNCLLKNVIIFFFGNQISKWRSFKKGAIFDLLFTFFSHQGKDTKISSAHITYIHTRIFLTLLTFFLTNFCKNCEFIMYGFSLVWLLVLILFHATLAQFIYTDAKFIVICKNRTLNDGSWRLREVQYRKRKKAQLLSSGHFIFSR